MAALSQALAAAGLASPQCAAARPRLAVRRRSSARVCRSQQGAGGCCGGGGSADGGCRGGDGASSEASRLEALLGSSAAPSQDGFNLGQMDGSITREVLQDVIGVMPEAMARPQAEKFLDVDGLLAEVRALGDDNFVF